MANKLYDETSIQAIANAIRGKNGSSDSYTVSQMAQAITDISGLSTYTFTKKLLFTSDGIGSSEWLDDTGNTALVLERGIYEAVEGEYLEINGNNNAMFNFPIDSSYRLFGIKCRIDPNFTPIQTQAWWQASVVLGRELNGTQRDFAIVIDKNGYFALGWATETITASSVNALDGNIHTLFVLAEQTKITLFIDGIKEVSVNIIMNGGEMEKMAVFNNGANAGLALGRIYSLGYWSYVEPSYDYNLPIL